MEEIGSIKVGNAGERIRRSRRRGEEHEEEWEKRKSKIQVPISGITLFLLSAPKIATAAGSEISVRSTRLIRVFSGADHMLSDFIAILGAVNILSDQIPDGLDIHEFIDVPHPAGRARGEQTRLEAIRKAVRGEDLKGRRRVETGRVRILDLQGRISQLRPGLQKVRIHEKHRRHPLTREKSRGILHFVGEPATRDSILLN